MLFLLVALILFASAACPVVSFRPSVGTDCAVAAKSAGDTARSGRGEDRRCAGGASAPAAAAAAASL